MNTTIVWLLLGSALFASFDFETNEFKLIVSTRQELVRHIQVQMATQQEYFGKGTTFNSGPMELDLH